MSKVKFVEIENSVGETLTHAIIEYSDGSFTSMLKSTYDEMIAKQELK